MAEDMLNQEQEQELEQPKTYTQEEVDRLLQVNGDKRVTQALAKQKKEYESKLSLAKLDGQAREQAEKDQTIADLQAQLAEYRLEKNRSELKSVLSSRGLPAQLADLINITDDLEESQGKIEALDKLIKQCVQQEVKMRLGTNQPQLGTSTEPTIDSFKKMTLAEQVQLFNTNPELYKKLSGN